MATTRDSGQVESNTDDDYYGDNGDYDEDGDYDEECGPPEELSRLERLPAELVHMIASHLPAPDLACLGVTSSILAEHARNDLLWAKLVNERLPYPIQDPGQFPTYRRLFLAYYPCWFVPQYKIWFADNENTGTLVISRYDHRRGVIEGYKLAADRLPSNFEVWESNPEVMVQAFRPFIFLRKDKPVFLLQDTELSSELAPIESSDTLSRWRRDPTCRSPALVVQEAYYDLSFCTSLDAKHVREASHDDMWPPFSIPGPRTMRRRSHLPRSQPEDFEQMSEMHFRITEWAPSHRLYQPFPDGLSYTYSTIDPTLYTPTPKKPYQGIWVGDYSAHGCEFILIMQKDVGPRPVPEDNDPMWYDAWGSDWDNDEEVAESTATDAPDNDQTGNEEEEEVGQQGRLEAVKLTGDPNVPRGQYSFIAKDIGLKGLIKIETSEPFVGARIVRCRGHVAGLGFHDNTFISSQLILVSPDCMAHYWVEMGHVSYYRRIDIDALVKV